MEFCLKEGYFILFFFGEYNQLLLLFKNLWTSLQRELLGGMFELLLQYLSWRQ